VKSGQYEAIRNNLKFVYDYFIKCHTAPNEFYAQVGNGDTDHSFWGAPEILPATMTRPSAKIDATHPGTEVAMETAAALAAGSILFADDKTYSELLLKHAKELYTFGNTSRGMYDVGVPAAFGFYRSYSGYQDELTWGGIWLYRATGNKTYLDNAETEFNNISNVEQTSFKPYKDSFSWDDKSYACYPLLAKLTDKQKYYDAAEKNLDFWTTGTGTDNKERITYSPGGEAYLRQWGSLRYASNMAFLALNYCDLTNANTSKKVTYKDFALKQINYVLGDNPRKSSYVCGFGKNPPVNPHHRGAHGCWTNNFTGPPINSRHILYGALVGGPKASDDAYIDDRTDYTANEVATDYNAGFTGAVAAIMATQTAFIPPPIPKETVGEEYVTSAKSNSIGTNYFEPSIKVQNHTAWPARKPAKLSFKYFIDISESISAGNTINDYSVVLGSSEGKPTISSLKLWKGSVYYVEIEYNNEDMFPGGQSESRRECQFRITGPPKVTWDSNNDFSYTGLTNSEALTQYVPVYENGVKVYGTEPPGGILGTEDFDIVANELKLYPNPAVSVLKINLPVSTQIKQIVLIDLSGKVVLKKTIENNSAIYNLDISTIPSGMYLVNFKSDDNVWTKKIIKQSQL
jgi:hypothetical protein